MLQKVDVERPCLVNKSVVKWFAQRRTYRNTNQVKLVSQCNYVNYVNVTID